MTRPANPKSHRVRRQQKAKRFSRKQLLGALTVAATVIGALSGSAALFEWFGKLNAPAPPPAVINAQLTPPTLISRHEPLGAFLSETSQSTKGLTAYELAEEGLEFLLGVHLQGDQGKKILLKWNMVDTTTGRPLTEPIYNQNAAVVRPRGPDQARQLPIWTPSPPRRGRFTFRAVLLDETHRPLVQAESKPFTAGGVPGG